MFTEMRLARQPPGSNNQRVQRTAFAGSFLGVLLAALLSSCGARTGLELAEACPSDGETRPCQDACGAGEQSCTAGYWSACIVPELVRGCENACGAGTETCRAGAWSACSVPEVVRACSDECGSGEDRCVEGAWQGCTVPEALRPCESVCGPGNEHCRAGKWGACDAPKPKPPQLRATVRDFSPETHPDFEATYQPGVDLGIVQERLGPDLKPVYAPPLHSKSTSGRENFDKWYRDDPINLASPVDLPLKIAEGEGVLFEYNDHDFFPIDGQLLGNEKRQHNYHFTLEASTYFQYIGGEVFSFSGDDDMWVFINHQLVIDLGGIHQSESASVELDLVAERLGLVQGETYDLHFFFAERHTIQSNFTIRTSIAEPGSCE
jgi:fibro-slime domain-containing protein